MTKYSLNLYLMHPLEIAYRQARYQINHSALQFEIQIGFYSPCLDELLTKNACRCAAFITAYNPRSQLLSVTENQAKHEMLKLTLFSLGCVVFEGISTDPQQQWPAEPSFLALGLTDEQAMQLALTYGQNAFLWAELHSTVELRWTPIAKTGVKS